MSNDYMCTKSTLPFDPQLIISTVSHRTYYFVSLSKAEVPSYCCECDASLVIQEVHVSYLLKESSNNLVSHFHGTPMQQIDTRSQSNRGQDAQLLVSSINL